MNEYIVPELLTECPLCGGKLVYSPHPRCETCHETFEYDPEKKVFRHPMIVDISYKNPESRLLSNLFPHKFKFKWYATNFGDEYASMEAFLRYLWFDLYRTPQKCRLLGMDNIPFRNEIAQLYGLDAVYVKHVLPDWKDIQGFYIYEETCINHEIKYVKHKIRRDSKEYQEILNRVYQCLFNDSGLFRLALAQTKGKTLIHSIGKDNPKETILTRTEFVENLYRLREQL